YCAILLVKMATKKLINNDLLKLLFQSMKISDSNLEQTSQMEYSQKTSNVSQLESSQTKQNIQKKNKRHHQSDQLVVKY
ncbi:29989_t:CDS:1, partial [Gigaspora margarita]